ncbi:MAG: thymidine kinase [Chlorobi bacterium]|nr:thymidine kinase [Chlorobiota bacterium]
MFLEEKVRTAGWIEVITGSMFSGKTEELIRRMKRAEIAQQKITIFKPKVETRYSEEMVVSHDAKSIKSIPVAKAEEILDLANGYEVIGIDEAQFFSDILVEVCNRLADKGIRVIVAGLDMDFAGKPFGPIPRLTAIAEYVSKVHAICMRCGNLAQYSHRLSDSDKQFLLGEKDIYEPLCRKCYNEAINKVKS